MLMHFRTGDVQGETCGESNAGGAWDLHGFTNRNDIDRWEPELDAFHPLTGDMRRRDEEQRWFDDGGRFKFLSRCLYPCSQSLKCLSKAHPVAVKQSVFFEKRLDTRPNPNHLPPVQENFRVSEVKLQPHSQ